MKKLFLIVFLIFSTLSSAVEVESLPDFYLNKYQYIYVIFYVPTEYNSISAITVTKVKQKVLSMLKGIGYNPVEVKSLEGNKYTDRPIVVVTMAEDYDTYKTGGYSIPLINYVPGETYTINTKSEVRGSYGRNSTYYGHGSSSTTIEGSGHYETNSYYVPERTEVVKYHYGSILVYKNSNLEQVFFARNDYSINLNYIDIADSLFLDIIHYYLPPSDYFKPVVEYNIDEGKLPPPYNNYLPRQIILKTAIDIEESLPKGSLVMYDRAKGGWDHLTDVITSLIVFYPFTKNPNAVLIVDKDGREFWINANNLDIYAVMYAYASKSNIKYLLSLVK